MSEQLLRLIDQLTEKLQRVVLLFYVEDYSVEEVSKMFVLPQNTVKSRLARARASLEKQLRARGLYDLRLWVEPGR